MRLEIAGRPRTETGPFGGEATRPARRQAEDLVAEVVPIRRRPPVRRRRNPLRDLRGITTIEQPSDTSPAAEPRKCLETHTLKPTYPQERDSLSVIRTPVCHGLRRHIVTLAGSDDLVHQSRIDGREGLARAFSKSRCDWTRRHHRL